MGASSAGSGSGFENTRWSLVAALGSGGDSAQASLLELCLRNWYPVYSYLRCCGHAPETAQELTRQFFDYLLNREGGHPDGARFGRFREFLRAELHAFLLAEREPLSARAPVPPLGLEELEQRQRKNGGHAGSPEQALRRGFALEIIGAVLRRLRGEARDAGRLAMFEGLERYLTSEPRPGELESVADALRTRPTLIAMAVRRLRGRFRELIDEELGDTVLNPEQLVVERMALYEALARNEA